MQSGSDSIEGFVISTIAELAHCPRDEVQPRRSLLDLGVDSLRVATLATFVEAAYGCTFTPAQLTTLYEAGGVDEVVLAVKQVVCGAADCSAVFSPPHGGQVF